MFTRFSDVSNRMNNKADAEGASLMIKATAFKEFRKTIAEGNKEAIQAFLEGIDDKSINAKSVLDFFSGLDEREAFRDAAAHGGKSVFIGDSASQGSGNRCGGQGDFAREIGATFAAMMAGQPAQKEA